MDSGAPAGAATRDAEFSFAFVLEERDGPYRLGDRVRGNVRVTSSSEMRSDRVVLALGWTTIGPGRRDRGRHGEVSFPVERWRPNQTQRFDFDFEIPSDGVLSYEGEALQIQWHVDTEIEIAWSTPRRARYALGVVPARTGVAITVPVREGGSLDWIRALLWGACTSGAAAAAVMIALIEPQWAMLVPAGVALCSSYVGWLYVRPLVARFVVRHVTAEPVDADSGYRVAASGPWLAVRVALRAPRARVVRATLRVVELSRKRDNEAGLLRHVRFASKDTLRPTGCEWVGHLPLPNLAMAPYSVRLKGNEVRWEVECEVELACGVRLTEVVRVDARPV